MIVVFQGIHGPAEPEKGRLHRDSASSSAIGTIARSAGHEETTTWDGRGSSTVRKRADRHNSVERSRGGSPFATSSSQNQKQLPSIRRRRWLKLSKEKAQDAGHKVAEKANELGHEIGEKAEEAKDWVKGKAHQAGNKIEEAGDAAKKKIHDATA